MLRTIVLVGSLAGCAAPPPDESDAATTLAGAALIGLVRDANDAPMIEAQVLFGLTAKAAPDRAGVVRFYDGTVGHIPIHVRDVALSADAEAAPDIAAETTATTRLEVTPASAVPIPDLAVGAELSADGLHLSWGEGSLAVDGLAAAGPGEATTAIATSARAVPGRASALMGDATLVDVTLERVVWLGPPLDAAGRNTGLQTPGTLLWDGPADVGQTFLRFDINEGYWRVITGTELIDNGLQATVSSFGWWSVGRVAPMGGCITGKVVAPTGAVSGAEVTGWTSGSIAVDRATSDDGGSFCVSGAVGDVNIDLFGSDRPGQLLFLGHFATTSAAGSCANPTTCADVGVLEPTVHPDVDHDGYHRALGDCDDDDATVNPGITYGDESYCADPS